MNKPVLLPQTDIEPRRWRFTVDDVERMQDAGVLPPDHRCELIHGDLIETPSEGDLHSFYKSRLTHSLARQLDIDRFTIGPDTTFFLDRHEAPEPDIFITTSEFRPSQARGQNALLVIEVANTSLAYDLEVKAPLYRAYGVREYWVVDVNRRVTHRHLVAGDDGDWALDLAPFGTLLRPSLLPDVALRLSDFG